jgi:plasmid stabilization system protein ParE
MKIVVSEPADADLRDIYNYLIEFNPAAAVATLSAINEKFESLSRFPFIGRERSNLGQGLRSIVSEPYVVF